MAKKMQPGWLLGSRINFQKQRLIVRRYRRTLVAECLRAGITNTKEIQAYIRQYGSKLPSSTRSIHRDKTYLQELREAEGRCDKCGQMLAPHIANEGGGEMSGLVIQDGD